MARLDSISAKQRFHPFLQPGEEVLHVAYGFHPLNVLLIIVLAVLTGGIAVVIAQGMRKHYLVGVTRGRLLLLGVGSFDSNVQPRDCVAIALNGVTRVGVSSGPIFVRLGFAHAGKTEVFKFHRAAFTGNREGAQAIGKALELGAAAPAPGSASMAPAVGTEILVCWADGAEYPARVTAMHGDQFLCRFPNGSETWAGAAFVRPMLPAAGASASAHGLTAMAQHSAPAPRRTGLIIGAAAAGIVVLVGLALTFYVVRENRKRRAVAAYYAEVAAQRYTTPAPVPTTLPQGTKVPCLPGDPLCTDPSTSTPSSLEQEVAARAKADQALLSPATVQLWEALAEEDLSAAERAARAGGDMNAQMLGRPMIVSLARNGKVESVKFALKRGANPNSRTSIGNRTPLHEAALHARTSVVKVLLANRAEPCATTNQGLTPLAYATGETAASAVGMHSVTAEHKSIASLLRAAGCTRTRGTPFKAAL